MPPWYITGDWRFLPSRKRTFMTSRLDTFLSRNWTDRFAYVYDVNTEYGT